MSRTPESRASQQHHPMPDGSLGLAEYAAAIVRLSFWKRDRSGRYRKATLIEKYGADVPLPELLHRIATNYPKMDALADMHAR